MCVGKSTSTRRRRAPSWPGWSRDHRGRGRRGSCGPTRCWLSGDPRAQGFPESYDLPRSQRVPRRGAIRRSHVVALRYPTRTTTSWEGRNRSARSTVVIRGSGRPAGDLRAGLDLGVYLRCRGRPPEAVVRGSLRRSWSPVSMRVRPRCSGCSVAWTRRDFGRPWWGGESYNVPNNRTTSSRCATEPTSWSSSVRPTRSRSGTSRAARGPRLSL